MHSLEAPPRILQLLLNNNTSSRGSAIGTPHYKAKPCNELVLVLLIVYKFLIFSEISLSLQSLQLVIMNIIIDLKKYYFFILFLTISSHSISFGADLDVSLNFMISGKTVNKLTLKDLVDNIKVYDLEFYDPLYKKLKRYNGFTIQDVLTSGFNNQWKEKAYTEVSFTALDGYEAIAKISKMFENGGYITFEDRDVNGWEPIGRKKAYPGPFYLVWIGENQIPKNEYPWPWQLVSINIMSFEEQYPSLPPTGVPEGSMVYNGFEIFKGRCIRCHSINRQGGKIGPDLNAPQNILSYRSARMVKEFIKNPSKYRYTNMPDHDDLSDNDLDSIVEYLWHKRKENK